MNKFFALVSILIIFTACGKDEKFIDNYTDSNKVLLSVNSDGKHTLAYMNLTDGSTISQDVFVGINGTPAPDSIGKTAIFRDHIFVFFPNIYEIIVLNRNDMTIAGTVSFAAESLVPSDICFANATDAYICHGNSNLVSLLDLTNLKIARQITVGKNPVAIVATGNQIYTANQGDNSVSVIDSRTNKQEAKISVPPLPTFIDIRANGNEVVVVSLGRGKIDAHSTKTPAIATFIDVQTRNIINETPIGVGTITPESVKPLSLSVTDRDWAFIPTEDNFLRLNIRTKTSVANIGRFRYSNTNYNKYNGYVIALQKDENSGTAKAVTCNNITGRLVYETPIPSGTQWILPIY